MPEFQGVFVGLGVDWVDPNCECPIQFPSKKTNISEGPEVSWLGKPPCNHDQVHFTVHTQFRAKVCGVVSRLQERTIDSSQTANKRSSTLIVT